VLGFALELDAEWKATPIGDTGSFFLLGVQAPGARLAQRVIHSLPLLPNSTGYLFQRHGCDSRRQSRLLALEMIRDCCQTGQLI
jgi:hypothetical protein